MAGIWFTIGPACNVGWCPRSKATHTAGRQRRTRTEGQKKPVQSRPRHCTRHIDGSVLVQAPVKRKTAWPVTPFSASLLAHYKPSDTSRPGLGWAKWHAAAGPASPPLPQGRIIRGRPLFAAEIPHPGPHPTWRRRLNRLATTTKHSISPSRRRYTFSTEYYRGLRQTFPCETRGRGLPWRPVTSCVTCGASLGSDDSRRSYFLG